MNDLRWPLFVALFLCLVSASGCATYWGDRARDLADIGQLNGGISMSGDPMPFLPSLFASAKLTRFGTVAAGWEWGENAGWYGRHFGWWGEQQWGMPFVWRDFREQRAWQRRKDEPREKTGTMTWALSERFDFLVALPSQHSWRPPWADAEQAVLRDMARPIRRFDISAEVGLLYPNLRVGISPGEILDFLGGFFLIDLARDDARNRQDDGDDSEMETD